jgi:hypothetical protein
MRRLAHARAMVLSVMLGSGTFGLLSASPASAHEDVKLGKVAFEIGFMNEPAYTGFQNGVFLLITGRDGRPVTNAANTLNVEVVYGEQRMQVDLEPNFDADAGGAPGQYEAAFIPTRPGAYTFHLSGEIDEQKIDRDFTSSPRTFDEVVDPTSVQFPAKDPTLGQVADRLNREFPRIETRLASAQRAATDRADSAKTLAYVGIGLGAVGLILALAALMAVRRRTASTA